MSNTLNLPTRFARRQRSLTAMLLCAFVITVTLGGWFVATKLNQNAHTQYIEHESELLLNMMDSVRDYTNTQLAPALEHQSDRFWPESVPSYASQQVFERLRQQKQYSDYFYKEAVLNPTNLRDKADKFEQDLIQQFRNNQIPIDKTISKKINTPQGERFYSAKAIIVSKPSCLQCHSTPKVAPKYVVEHYGTENGFDWRLNEIVGAQMLYLPVDEFTDINRPFLSKSISILVAIISFSLIVIGLWL